MDTKYLMLLIEMFLQPTYTIEMAVALIGPVKDDTLPNTLDLQARDPNIEHAMLEYLETEDGRFLSGLLLRFETLVDISFAKLTARYGEGRPSRRLKPEQPRPFHFQLAEHPLKGDLFIATESYDDKAAVRPVRYFKIIRHQPREASVE